MENRNLPPDYEARVYAGWLGKVIGVRFGAPIENWTYEEIRDNIGVLDGYLREDMDKLFKPDDDTSVPMILIRAFENVDTPSLPTAAQFGETWLNFLGDQHGTLWWGGYGVSTEHTAYLNLVNGIPAPLSGSIALNGATLAEQIGGQIFSDIFGWVAPDDPARAADLAERAARVSHDGEGVYGGRFIAAMVSAAFRERDPLKLIEIGLAQIPANSDYTCVVRAMIDHYQREPDDWHSAFAQLKRDFGYDRYGGIVHIIPNAGVVALALLYGGGDFTRSIQIANMAGWDTDCNVGNVGAILGTAVGVEGIETRWREPIRDLLITASVIGTRNINTLGGCVDLFCGIGYRLAGMEYAERPRYHFRYPGATSNFEVKGAKGRAIELRQTAALDDNGALQVSIRKLNKKGEIRVFTRTFYRANELGSNYYGATFTPLIAPGQRLYARVFLPADAPGTIVAALYTYDAHGKESVQASALTLSPGQWHDLSYAIPALADACLSEAGIIIRNMGELWETGAIYLSELDWGGAPEFSTTFAHEQTESGAITCWSWLRGYWRLEADGYHGGGVGICETYTGDIRWQDYSMRARIVPSMGEHHLILTRVQGAQQGYAFGLSEGRTLRMYKNDGGYKSVASVSFDWEMGKAYDLMIRAQGNTLTGAVFDAETDALLARLAWTDEDSPYLHGQVGLSTWHGGHLCCQRLALSSRIEEALR